jgi:hypothetical protein
MQYTKGTMELLAVATEICRFFEQVGQNVILNDFVAKTTKLLPLLYLKTSMIEPPNRIFEQEPDRFVTEKIYDKIRENFAELLGEKDSFLTVFHENMTLSDKPVVAFVSENMADIYQDLKDFVYRCGFQDEQIMSDALAICIENFREIWGVKLLNALAAMHLLQNEK